MARPWRGGGPHGMASQGKREDRCKQMLEGSEGANTTEEQVAGLLFLSQLHEGQGAQDLPEV